jgi:hypothetical protein
MNRYVLIATVVAVPFLVVAAAFGFHGVKTGGAEPTTSTAPQAPRLADGRYFALLGAANDDTVTFDVADLLTGEAANEYAAAHGLEVPVPNDVVIDNEQAVATTLPLAPDARILLMDWSRCCEPLPADRDLLAASADAPGYGYWITVRSGVVRMIVEQYHP